MRYDPASVADARVVGLDELAQIVDAASPSKSEHVDFEMPRWIWGVMLAGYATLFAGLIGATGGEAASVFAIAIGALYTAMFFGTACVLASVDGRKVGAFTGTAEGKLKTATGPMSMASVASQVLVIPVLLGFFGVSIAVISAFVM